MRVALFFCIAVSSAARAQPVPAPAPKPADAKPADAKPTDAKSLTKFDISKVETLFDEGTKHYNVGEWDAAIIKFKQAYTLMPDPSFLFNLGQAYRQKGACREATAVYKSYLRHATDDRAKVEQFIGELAPCVQVEEEKARRLLPPPKLTPRHRKLRLGGMVTAGAGLLAIGGASYFGIRALRAENDLEQCNISQCDGADAIAIDRRGRRAERNATILGITGGSVLAIGAAVFAYSRFNPEYIAVSPTAGGIALSATGRF